MKIKKTIRIEMSDWNPRQQFGESAMLGDSGGRVLEFELRERGKDWVVPEGVIPALAFRNGAGFAGEYDTMPDGTSAYVIEGNRVSFRLVEQVTAAAGQVKLMLVLRDQALGQISSFPFYLEVVEGIEGVEPLPKSYFRVSTLGDMTRELEQIEQMLQKMDGPTVLKAAEEAAQAARDARNWAASVNAEEIAAAIAERGEDLCIRDGRLYLLSGERLLGNGADAGLVFDGGYVDSTGFLHLTMDGTEVEGFTPFFVGSGGSASVMTLTSKHEPVFSILEREESCVIDYVWSSAAAGAPTGSGVAEWTVNGARVAIGAVEQGSGSFDVRPFLEAGAENEVVLKVTDVYGAVRRLVFLVTVKAYTLSWNLGEMAVQEGDLTIRLTPGGTGEKLVKVAVDGTVVFEKAVSTSGRTVTAEIPARTHGAHLVTAWLEIPELQIETRKLEHRAVWLSEGFRTPVVGVLTPQLQVSQYGTAAVRWFAIDPASETASVELRVDGNRVNALEQVGRGVHVWTYRAAEPGAHTLSIHCVSVSGSVRLTVAAADFELRPVTAGLELDLDPTGHSNSEALRGEFGYRDGQGVNHPLVFSENFDWVGGGFREDEEGVTAFVVKRGCSVMLDRSLFDSDCSQTGRHMKLVYKCENVRRSDAGLMACKSGNVGLSVTARRASVSSQLERMEVRCCEGRKVELDVCIQAQAEGGLAWLDLKGIQSCPPVRCGSADGWAQTQCVPLTIGSQEADVWIYRLKLWGNSLNRYEVLDEHIACAGNPGEMAQRYYKNEIYNPDGSINPGKAARSNPELRVIHLRAGRMSTGAEDPVTAELEQIYAAGGEQHHLTAHGVTLRAKGAAAPDLELDFSTAGYFVNGLGEQLTDYAMTERSIPVRTFELKANLTSSDGCNHVCLSEEYQRLNPYVCDPRLLDPRARDTAEGHPCAVFFTSTAQAAIQVGGRTVQPGETILCFVGDLNNSWQSDGVFGRDNGVYPNQCCVELMSNTDPACRFREALPMDGTGIGGNFRFRFPETPTAAMQEAFTAMQRWVVSTDREAATGMALSAPVALEGKVYEADTAEYRAAKFRSGFEDYFVAEAMDFHYLFTDVNCMTESRAKHLLFSYEWVQAVQDYRWSVRCSYDNHIALGSDSTGSLTLDYGLEDRDKVVEKWVFSAQDSVLWCNIRDLRSEELRNLYIRLAGQGAWDAADRAERFRAYQSAVCEGLRSEDLHNKYFRPWIEQGREDEARLCLGTKEAQREQFFRDQERYKGSQYCDESNRTDAITMSVTLETAEQGDLTVTTYSDLYVVVLYGDGLRIRQRVKANTPTRIACPSDAVGAEEISILSASDITGLSSLAELKPESVQAGTALRLQELTVGSGETGYQNQNLKRISVGSNRMLRELDLRGCPNLTVAPDLRELTGLERFLASGSGITGVRFAQGCPLKEVWLPAVSVLTALELDQVTDFRMDPGKLTRIWVENCPGIDTLNLCKGAGMLQQGRITGIDWEDADAALLLRLAEKIGMDGQGRPTARFVLTGKAHVAAISQEQLDRVREAFPELELSYGEIVESVTVTFVNYDGTVLDTQLIHRGGNAVNPAAAGLIDTPVRASDAEFSYHFSGWNAGLNGITADLVVRAVYAASDRYYRVTYWADKNRSALLQQEQVIAHGSSEYKGTELPDGDQIWMGWDQDASDVVSDLDICPLYITPRLPDTVPEKFGYLYSDDPNDDSAYTLEEFAGVVRSGQARAYFQPGDLIKIVPHTTVFNDESIVLRVEGFVRYALAEADGMAGVLLGMVGVMNNAVRMRADGKNSGGWRATELRSYLNGIVYPELPLWMRKLLRRVTVRSSNGDGSGVIVSSGDWLFLPAIREVGLAEDVTPYCDEIDPGAEGTVLPLYADGASRVKYRFNGTGTAASYFTRSPDASHGDGFFHVLESGAASTSHNSGSPNGISWMCCM